MSGESRNDSAFVYLPSVPQLDVVPDNTELIAESEAYQSLVDQNM